MKLDSEITVTKVTAYGDEKSVMITRDHALELSYEASVFLSAIIECDSDDSAILRLSKAFPGVDERRLRDDLEEFAQILVRQQILVSDLDP
jgi:hypothetical protein